MVQDMQQGHHMLLVASEALGLPNIVDNHVQNFFTAVVPRRSTPLPARTR